MVYDMQGAWGGCRTCAPPMTYTVSISAACSAVDSRCSASRSEGCTSTDGGRADGGTTALSWLAGAFSLLAAAADSTRLSTTFSRPGRGATLGGRDSHVLRPITCDALYRADRGQGIASAVSMRIRHIHGTRCSLAPRRAPVTFGFARISEAGLYADAGGRSDTRDADERKRM